MSSHEDFLASPAMVDGETVFLPRKTVEDYHASLLGDRSLAQAWMMLRQRLDQAHFENIDLPGDLDQRYDALLESHGIVYVLERQKNWRVVMCFDLDIISKRPAHSWGPLEKSKDDVFLVWVTDHAVERYMERIDVGADADQARERLQFLVDNYAVLQPDVPGWLVDQPVKERASFFLVLEDFDFALPIRVNKRTQSSYSAVTLVAKGANETLNNKKRTPRKQEKNRANSQKYDQDSPNKRRKFKGKSTRRPRYE